eukprot:9109155-Ditylum_brightwellii.AAC.1
MAKTQIQNGARNQNRIVVWKDDSFWLRSRISYAFPVFYLVQWRKLTIAFKLIYSEMGKY